MATNFSGEYVGETLEKDPKSVMKLHLAGWKVHCCSLSDLPTFWSKCVYSKKKMSMFYFRYPNRNVKSFGKDSPTVRQRLFQKRHSIAWQYVNLGPSADVLATLSPQCMRVCVLVAFRALSLLTFPFSKCLLPHPAGYILGCLRSCIKLYDHRWFTDGTDP